MIGCKMGMLEEAFGKTESPVVIKRLNLEGHMKHDLTGKDLRGKLIELEHRTWHSDGEMLICPNPFN